MSVSDDNNIVESAALNTQSETTVGEMLAAAREAKNLSQQDVSNYLRFSIKQVDALENNKFSALPDATTTRGFIRNYARFLELDAEPLLATYSKQVPEELRSSTLAVHSSMRPIMLTKESPPWLRYILGSILVLLFLLAWLFYTDYMPKPVDAPADTLPEIARAAEPVNEVPALELALPAAERQVEGGDVTSVAGDANVANQDVAGAAANTTQADMQLPSAATADSNVKVVTMAFSEQTWVSVKDESGQVIFEKMAAAGSTEQFDGTPPFNLVIGNARATKLEFFGQEVDLAAHTKANVARVRLE